MNSFMVFTFLMILSAISVDACNYNGTLIEGCQCVVQKFIKVINDVRSELPMNNEKLAEKLGYFEEKEWNMTDIVNLIEAYAKEFEDWYSDEKIEIYKEFQENDWKDLVKDRMMEEYQKDEDCFHCCIAVGNPLLVYFRMKVGVLREE